MLPFFESVFGEASHYLTRLEKQSNWQRGSWQAEGMKVPTREGSLLLAPRTGVHIRAAGKSPPYQEDQRKHRTRPQRNRAEKLGKKFLYHHISMMRFKR